MLAGSVLACLFIPLSSFAAPPDRLRGPIDGNRVSALPGKAHHLARPEFAQGSVSAETTITGISLDLMPTAEQQASLDIFLEDQRDPASPEFQRWLTPGEFADRFGVSQNDMARLTSWLEAQGFSIDHVGEARNWVLFSGSAGQVRRTFRTQLRRYLVEGEIHYANETAPSIPLELAGVIGSIRGLDDFRPRPNRIMNPRPLFNTGGTHYLGPDDLAAIYNISALYKAGFDGAGQKLVIAGQSAVDLADIRQFRSQFGLPPKDPQVVLVGSDPGVRHGDVVEADLDLEWAGAVARNATIIYVNSTNVFTSVQYAINQNLAPVISFSYGACELNVSAGFRSVAQQAAAQGITWLTSSGDSGAAACDYGATVARNGPAVSFPANIPEIVAVGGTEFNESGTAGWASANGTSLVSALGYLPEKGWNDTAGSGGLASTGGGLSTLYARPWWQTGKGVPGGNQRAVPDVSLTASGSHDGYIVISAGSLLAVGGTSASSPAFAGIVTLLNQYLVANGTLTKPGLGNLNPALYALAGNSTGIFHDITEGDNIVPCAVDSPGCSDGSFGFHAGPGYDMVTGLGSVDAYNMVTKWTSLPAGVGTSTVLTASPSTLGASVSTQLTATVTPVSGTNPPTGSVTFTNGKATFGSVPVVAGVALLTLKGSLLAPGANAITAEYAAAAGFRNSANTITLTLTPPVVTNITVTATPAVFDSLASTVVTIAVKAVVGAAPPTGTVTLAADGTSLGTASLLPSATGSSAAITLKGSALRLGENKLTAAYTATGNFGNSSANLDVTLTLTRIETATTLSASAAGLAASASTILTATVKPASGSGAPGGQVEFQAGKILLGAVALSAAGTANLIVAGTAFSTGANSVTASYKGSPAFYTSASGPLTVTVAPPVTTTAAVTATPTTLASSANAQLTVTVKARSGAAVPAGSVIFSANGLVLGNSALVSGVGSASATFLLKGKALPVGVNSVSAVYAGSGGFSGSEATVSVTIQPPPTTITVTASPYTLARAASTKLAAIVRLAGGAGTPAGQVTFSIGGKLLGKTNLDNGGGASFSIQATALAIGANTVTVSYLPSGDFVASSTRLQLTVR